MVDKRKVLAYACWWYTTPGKNCTTYSYSDAKASSTKSVEELIAYIVDNCEIDDTFYPAHKFGRRCTYHESESYMRMWCDWVDLNKDSRPTVSEYEQKLAKQAQITLGWMTILSKSKVVGQMWM